MSFGEIKKKVFIIVLLTVTSSWATNIKNFFPASSGGGSSSAELQNGSYYSIGGTGGSTSQHVYFCSKKTVDSYGKMSFQNINNGGICDVAGFKYCKDGLCNGSAPTKILAFKSTYYRNGGYGSSNPRPQELQH